MEQSKTKNLFEIVNEYCCIEIPDYYELLRYDPTMEDLKTLISKEMEIERRELCSDSELNNKELLKAAQVLDKYYYCMEQTLNRLIYKISIKFNKHECENIISVLNWKRNTSAIRRYVAYNIVSEINQTGWDLTPHMINNLFKRKITTFCKQ
jgi:hypothetical protein